MKLTLALLTLLAPAAAFAASDVALTSDVFVERTSVDAAGKPRVTLDPTKIVVPGDRLVFVLAYHNTGKAPAADFVVTNPVPASIAYQGSADRGALVSVDGARNWGALPVLTIRNADGTQRAAASADVTHIRWAMATPIPAGATGKLSFRGLVK